MDDNAAKFVGEIPRHYDEGLGPLIFADIAQDTAARINATKPARVLELAAGTGIVTRALRSMLPPTVHLTATDLNPPMLEVAKAKIRPGEQVAFQQADATALPFADRSFDAVACQFGVMFFPDKDKGYAEALRVLTPGGIYVFNTWDGLENNPFGGIAFEAVNKLFPADPPQFLRVPFSYPFGQIKDSLVKAGFTDITASVWRTEKAVPDVALLARGVVYGNPMFDQIRARAGVSTKDVFDVLVDAFTKAFGPSGQMPLQALVYSARRPA